METEKSIAIENVGSVEECPPEDVGRDVFKGVCQQHALFCQRWLEKSKNRVKVLKRIWSDTRACGVDFVVQNIKGEMSDLRAALKIYKKVKII